MSSKPLPTDQFTSIPKIESYFRHEIIKTKSLLSHAQELLHLAGTNPAQDPTVNQIIQNLLRLSISQHKVQIEALAITAAREIHQYVMWVASEALKEMERTWNVC
jgi:hypothetical protein